MFAVLALGTLETLLNQWIDLDAATRQQLNGLQGKLLRVVIDSPQLSVDVFFDYNRMRLSPTVLGMPAQRHTLFEQRPYDAALAPQTANTTLHVANLVALGKLLTAQAGATGNVPLQGEMSLLQQLQRILLQAQPDLASHLSPWIGAIAARQLDELMGHGKKTLKQVAGSVQLQAEEILREDSQLLAPRWQMQQLNEHIRTLRQDIERAQARLQQIEQQVQARLNRPAPS